MYVDSHCHLDGPKFAQDREQVIARAREAGVEALVAIGNGRGPDDVACGIRLAEEYGLRSTVDARGESQKQVPRFARDDTTKSHEHRFRIYATLGIHPHEAALAEERHFGEMEKLARDPKVIAWGEIGLDYFYDHSPRDVQQKVFVRQMELARAAKLPIVIHNRPSDNSDNAWQDLFRLLREHWASSGLGGILHCFTGTVEQARAGMDLGFMISFAGNVSYPKAVSIREAAAQIPLERMLIETDSPYLAPVPHRGKRNEPAFVAETARHIGELRGISGEEVGAATTENFYRFFGIG
ncbi:MAG: TatD family hydrolase [Acidobacteriia bacterium]|nr:TatD family hydrolase [Terriglobia bacterium]